LFIAQAPSEYYRSPLIAGTRNLFIGPDILKETEDFWHSVLKLNNDELDGLALADRLNGLDWNPDITFIKADATGRVNIKNLTAIEGKKILLMGDTHHLKNPIQRMLSYSLGEHWDLITSEHDRHHLPFFSEIGHKNLIWLPCFSMNPYSMKPSNPTDSRPVFVGSLSPHHQHRKRILENLLAAGVQLKITNASQHEASKLYNQHNISINISLNGDFNFRIMEVLAAGGCLLTDRLGPDSGLNQLFTEGVHYLGYNSASEAVHQIKVIIDNPSMRMQIAHAGFNRFWSCCSPEIQSSAVLKALAGKAIPEQFKAPK
jgi:hypothetical protein